MGKLSILLFVITFTLTSCSNMEEHKMKSSIEEYLEENAKDPNSYEFIELTMIDTITNFENTEGFIKHAKFEISTHEFWIEYHKRNVELDKEIFGIKYNSEKEERKIKEYERKIKELESEIELYGRKISRVNDKEVFEYVASHKYRIKNGFGALDLYESKVVFDAEFNVKTHSND